MNTKRVYWLDIARVVAIISISLNHAVNRTYDNYINTQYEANVLPILDLLVKTTVTVFSRIGVPVFLIISGVLLLNKRFHTDQDIKNFYTHNFLRVLITSEIWYIIMYWLIVVAKSNNGILETMTERQNVFNSVMNMFFINQTTLGSMWYMPMILCLYLIVPWTSVVVKQFSRKYIFIPIIVAILCGMLVPNMNAFLTVNSETFHVDSAFSVENLFSIYLVYMILGYYVGKDELFINCSTKTVFLLAILSYLFCCMYQYYAYIRPSNYLVSYDFIGILICSLSTSEFIKRTEKYYSKIEKIVMYISKIAFGIYFLHIVLMEFLNKYFDFGSISYIGKLVVLELISVGGSILIIWLLSSISFFKKYVFLIKD